MKFHSPQVHWGSFSRGEVRRGKKGKEKKKEGKRRKTRNKGGKKRTKNRGMVGKKGRWETKQYNSVVKVLGVFSNWAWEACKEQ